MNLFCKIYDYFYKLDVDEAEVQHFIKDIRLLKKYIDISKIDKIYKINSEPFLLNTYNELESVLREGVDIREQISLENTDWLNLYYTENKDHTKTLFLTRMKYIFSEIAIGYIQTIKVIPKFAIRNKLIYHANYFYTSLDLAKNEKIFIDISKI
jgi:hypothetical protein